RSATAWTGVVAGVTLPAGPQLLAQAIFGSIQGSVSDDTGAVTPRARVTAAKCVHRCSPQHRDK
ncbi:MAG TPA: hypothetical protein VES20_10095, partial [Bryobacteraceae bacterium]|nr:hypothetical protein [Bryobacteraceae bacterium]